RRRASIGSHVLQVKAQVTLQKRAFRITAETEKGNQITERDGHKKAEQADSHKLYPGGVTAQECGRGPGGSQRNERSPPHVAQKFPGGDCARFRIRVNNRK